MWASLDDRGVLCTGGARRTPAHPVPRSVPRATALAWPGPATVHVEGAKTSVRPRRRTRAEVGCAGKVGAWRHTNVDRWAPTCAKLARLTEKDNQYGDHIHSCEDRQGARRA
jgi:hypothetical protein